MKVAIMGSRSIDDKELVFGLLNDARAVYGEPRPAWTVLGGGANGADQHIKAWADGQSMDFVHFEPHHRLDPAAEFDPRYFFIRNKAVVRNADECIAIWDGVSTDIKQFIDYAERLNRQVTVITVTEGSSD